jgi:hypothetical protein
MATAHPAVEDAEPVAVRIDQHRPPPTSELPELLASAVRPPSSIARRVPAATSFTARVTHTPSQPAGPADGDAAHRPATSGGSEPPIGVVVVLEGPAEQAGVEIGRPRQIGHRISTNMIKPASIRSTRSAC